MAFATCVFYALFPPGEFLQALFILHFSTGAKLIYSVM